MLLLIFNAVIVLALPVMVQVPRPNAALPDAPNAVPSPALSAGSPLSPLSPLTPSNSVTSVSLAKQHVAIGDQTFILTDADRVIVADLTAQRKEMALYSRTPEYKEAVQRANELETGTLATMLAKAKFVNAKTIANGKAVSARFFEIEHDLTNRHAQLVNQVNADNKLFTDKLNAFKTQQSKYPQFAKLVNDAPLELPPIVRPSLHELKTEKTKLATALDPLIEDQPFIPVVRDVDAAAVQPGIATAALAPGLQPSVQPVAKPQSTSLLSKFRNLLRSKTAE